MYGIFYNYINDQDFLCHYMVGITIYKTKESAEKVLRAKYKNDQDYTVEELQIMA